MTASHTFYWCFTILRHFLGHFGRSQLTLFLGSLTAPNARSFASNLQLPFLNQRKRENSLRIYFMTTLHKRMLPDVRIEPATARIPGGRGSDRATAPQHTFLQDYNVYLLCSSDGKVSISNITRKVKISFSLKRPYVLRGKTKYTGNSF